MQLEQAQHSARARITYLFGPLSRFLFVLSAAALSLIAPAAVLAQQPAQTGAQVPVATRARAGEGDSIRPFHINVPPKALDDLRRRLTATQWPEKETVADQSQGVPLATMQELARYWASEYDWRKAEAKLNALPQFVTNIDGLDIHFIHVRSKNPNALPLIISHGWPGSVLEQIKLIGPLTDPVAYGGKAEDSFDIVIPSMPGYGFSGKPTSTGWGPEHMARAWAELMRRLGYTRYVAQGGDWGAFVVDQMGLAGPAGIARPPHQWEYKGGFFNAKGVSIPVAVTVFPGEQYQAPRSWTERAYHKLIYYNRVEKGGHFAAWEQPELFAAELRAAFKSLR